MKTDAQLKTEVMDELAWEPSIRADHVGVAVDHAVVTLSGHLDTYAEKFAIEQAVRRVSGVLAVAVELDVKLAPGHQRSDTEIALAAEAAFRWHALVPAQRLCVKVEHGWVSLSGEVDWDFQRREAEQAVRTLLGVVGLSNLIVLKEKATPADVQSRIREALQRHADREARHIEVRITGATVTLRGTVDSWAERQAAVGAAWAAPGIGNVVNDLQIRAPA